MNLLQRYEAAKPLAEIFDLEYRIRHHHLLGRRRCWTSPTMPFGAIITNATNSSPTISRFAADEMVTVAICWEIDRRTAPTSGPIQDVVPPITGMAIALTA